MAALAFLIWDNIPRGTQITCPHIERSCTSGYYTDRKLGVSETVATAASTIMLTMPVFPDRVRAGIGRL